jgi:hypothetical protein
VVTRGTARRGLAACGSRCRRTKGALGDQASIDGRARRRGAGTLGGLRREGREHDTRQHVGRPYHTAHAGPSRAFWPSGAFRSAGPFRRLRSIRPLRAGWTGRTFWGVRGIRIVDNLIRRAVGVTSGKGPPAYGKLSVLADRFPRNSAYKGPVSTG